MKYRYTKNSEVAHRWANQTQDSARSSNVSFTGEYFYSYNTPIARLHTVNGHKVVVVSDVYYSQTTAKHKSDVRRAASHLIVLHCESGIDSVEAAILNEQGRVIEEIMRAFTKKTSSFSHFTYELEGIEDAVLEFNQTAKALGFDRLVLDSPPPFNSFSNDDFWSVFFEVVIHRAKENEKTTKEKELKRKEKLKNEIAEALPIWLSGGNLHPSLYSLSPQQVRVHDSMVQTTKGASISIKKAASFLKLIQSGEIKKGHKVEGFPFESLNGDELVIGCHTLSLKQCIEAVNGAAQKETRSVASNVVQLFGGSR